MFCALSIFCDVLRSFQILSGVYRGRLILHPEFLAAAVKIIMHTNYVYTKHHQQRTHELLLLGGAPLPPAPVIDTGATFESLSVGMRVEVWWLDDWWSGTVVYRSPRARTISVRFTGAATTTSGLLPKMIRPLHA